jgi:hypothetical protein
MTVARAGRKQSNGQIRCGKDLLLSCLSRLILEGQRVEARSVLITNAQLPDPIIISRAIVRETLSFNAANGNVTATARVPIQVPGLTRT